MAAEVHAVCGSTGAGKTTYARALAARTGAVRFSIDEWMTQLFWMDTPHPLVPAWSMERVERCSRQIWSTTRQLCAAGVPVVLDLGFTTAAARAEAAALSAEAGATFQLHLVDAPAGERWRRVEERNAEPTAGAQLPFAVDRAMFDFVEGLWEPPAPEELARFGAGATA